MIYLYLLVFHSCVSLLEGQASRNDLVDHQENDHHIIPYPEQMMGLTMTEKPCGMDPKVK